MRRACRPGCLLLLALLSLLAACESSSRRIPQIGIVWGTFPDASRVLFEPLRDGLRDLGYVEGRNIVFEQ